MASIGTAVERFAAEVGALVEAHAATAKARDFTKYAEDPVGFLREVLHAEPWSRQAAIAELVRDHRLVVVRSCVGAGKDWLAAGLALWWVFARRGYALITGPTDRQCKEILMQQVRRHFARAKELPGDLYEMALRVGGEEQQGILAYVSRDAGLATGFHAPRVMCILTEAQSCEPFAWEAAHSNASSADSRILAVGNPLYDAGRFFEVSRAPHWEAVVIPAAECPNVIARREVIPGGITVEQIQTLADEYGSDSALYRSRVLAEFPETGLDSLVKRSWLDAAVARYESGALETASVHQGPYTAALDPARLGADKSCLALRQGPVLRKLVLWAARDTMATCGMVVEQLREAKAPLLTRDEARGDRGRRQTRKLIIDEIGLGAGVLDRLREQHFPVEGFNGARTPRLSSEAQRYANERAAAFFGLRKRLEEGTIALPRDPLLFEELATMQWKVGSDGRVLIERKDEFKARLGRSPDRADAVAMAFSEGAAVAYDATEWATFTR
jgi:hypothetical protein